MVALLSSRQLCEMIDADIAEIEALNAFAESEKREEASQEGAAKLSAQAARSA